ncbi:response regulator [Schinkia azotoformans]|uniref:histidine kinase n=1 Tax=Schinkia azotoformans LMG 9581 TaxID=1131731 RepID=K6E6V7_SCHAZ|nr:response regulator [Schinkia azotoformans]EKN68996.1 multi-sensor signal transduction histidine kinase [Schinkia azotoformans LMG 9581]MEC1638410.1 response regulator [Schinkia azotoformans]MEC1946156.1 response regulator [Schinkia azotoformans]MED4352452.1 response regulator [Schinkia azotoformans]
MDNNRKINILLVDDRPENLLTLEAVLDSPSYNLIMANSGEEALKQVLKQDFAVILLDVQMPGLNGFDTARLIHGREQSKHIPIIFITAISQAVENVNQGYAVGAVDYIFKPFNPEILKSKVAAFAKLYEYQQQINDQRQLLKKRSIELAAANAKLQDMEKELLQHNNNLENLVREKTEELVLANKDLYQSQERFQKIFASSPSLIAIRSLIDGRYIDVNESWIYYTGFPYDEVIGKQTGMLHLMYDNCDTTQDLDLQKAIRNERIHYTTCDGKERIGLLSTEAAEIHGEHCIISVITDITERERLEKELTRLDRLNLIGEMAAGIAHEVRNPMTTVSGFLQLAKSKQDMHLEYIDLMLTELNRANEIIKEFLTLAKNKTSDRKPQNLNDIIEALYPLIQAEAVLSNKSVHLGLSECLPLYLDEKEIRQLILNIALNGLEAMSLGGKLTIKTYSADDCVTLEIQDEGCGIDRDVLEKIGTPFFTTKDTGTGLGLAVCYSVASRHNADICIQTSDTGTTFSIRFSA